MGMWDRKEAPGTLVEKLSETFLEPKSVTEPELEPIESEPEFRSEDYFDKHIFWVDVFGVPDGWHLVIRTTLTDLESPFSYEVRSTIERPYYAKEKDLSKYGQTEKTVSMCYANSEKMIETQAKEFLAEFKRSYERCQIQFSVEKPEEIANFKRKSNYKDRNGT